MVPLPFNSVVPYFLIFESKDFSNKEVFLRTLQTRAGILLKYDWHNSSIVIVWVCSLLPVFVLPWNFDSLFSNYDVSNYDVSNYDGITRSKNNYDKFLRYRFPTMMFESVTK